MSNALVTRTEQSPFDLVYELLRTAGRKVRSRLACLPSMDRETRVIQERKGFLRYETVVSEGAFDSSLAYRGTDTELKRMIRSVKEQIPSTNAVTYATVNRECFTNFVN